MKHLINELCFVSLSLLVASACTKMPTQEDIIGKWSCLNYQIIQYDQAGLRVSESLYTLPYDSHFIYYNPDGSIKKEFSRSDNNTTIIFSFSSDGKMEFIATTFDSATNHEYKSRDVFHYELTSTGTINFTLSDEGEQYEMPDSVTKIESFSPTELILFSTVNDSEGEYHTARYQLKRI